MPRIRVVAAVIERDGKYLITQRREEAVLALLWEFPGGKVEGEGEADSDAATLEREVFERVGAKIVVGAKVAERHHVYDGYEVTLAMYGCLLAPGEEPRALRVREVRWVTSTEFANYKFPPADQQTMDELLGVKRWTPG